MHFALENNDALREEICWSELVKTIAGIRDSLSPVQQASVGVLVNNYGEQGAVELMGPAYKLPMLISLTIRRGFAGFLRRPFDAHCDRLLARSCREGVHLMLAGWAESQ